MKSRSLVLLSGEGTTIPEGEARSLFLTYDPSSSFEHPSSRILIATSEVDPFLVGSRIAFARRVGLLIDDPTDAAPLLRGHRFRFRCFDLDKGKSEFDPEKYLRGLDGEIDLADPELELTLVRDGRDLLSITAPGKMRQAWSQRRPRRRPFFHPSAIFPKLSRALFNLSRCKVGETFLDPFAGTGSIPLEAALIGARVVAVDQSFEMARGALSNMKGFGQEWQGVIRADTSLTPIRSVDAVATDIPYGRASSTHGKNSREVLAAALPILTEITKSGGFLVIMHPHDLAIEGNSNLQVQEEHHLHVHKLLTRTITILRRR